MLSTKIPCSNPLSAASLAVSQPSGLARATGEPRGTLPGRRHLRPGLASPRCSPVLCSTRLITFCPPSSKKQWGGSDAEDPVLSGPASKAQRQGIKAARPFPDPGHGKLSSTSSPAPSVLHWGNTFSCSLLLHRNNLNLAESKFCSPGLRRGDITSSTSYGDSN